MLALLVAFAVAGAAVKIMGGLLYGSEALLVDALTCVANLVALTGTIYYYRASKRPPDEDHHFGHLRLGFGGVVVTLTVYSFVAGLVVARLLTVGKYTVDVKAPIAAAVGFLFYLAAILLARRVGAFFAAYAGFTGSELLEGGIVIVASLAGALYSYLLDYLGAIVITLYLFHELYEHVSAMIRDISDIAPPSGLIEEIRADMEREGLIVKRVRLRHIYEGSYQGDAVVAVDPSRSLPEIHEVIDRVQERLKKKHGVEIVIHVEPKDF